MFARARTPGFPIQAISSRCRRNRDPNPVAVELPDYQRCAFDLDDAPISSFVSSGHGTPVLFIHGNSSCKEIWANQLALLAGQGRPFAALDLPGHGQSGNARSPRKVYSFPGYAGVIGELLTRLDWPSVDVVGWSLGGHIGLELLGTDTRVRSLLIVGTPPVRPSPHAVTEGFHASNEMQLAGKRAFSVREARTYACQMLGGDRFVTPHLLENVMRTDGDARHFMLENALSGTGMDARLIAETTHKPLCVVHGENEPFVCLNYLMSIRYRALWNGSISLIRSAGHAPHWEKPNAFNAVLSSFLHLESSKSAHSKNICFALAPDL